MRELLLLSSLQPSLCCALHPLRAQLLQLVPPTPSLPPRFNPCIIVACACLNAIKCVSKSRRCQR